LWFDRDAEEAAAFYVSLLPNSRIGAISRYGPGAPLPEGTALVVPLTLDGTPFALLNGGPHFRLTEAASIMVACDTQTEIDRLWDRLTADGGAPGRCGWLKDRYGVSWQIFPSILPALMTGPHKARVVAAFMPMTKLDIATIEAAARGA
jgi:predicted 3-demethylubiquinone-9 3-methyltransferase (glyoxalase superfamily)